MLIQLQKVNYCQFPGLDVFVDNDETLYVSGLSIAELLDISEPMMEVLTESAERYADKELPKPLPLIQFIDDVPTPITLYPMTTFMMFFAWQIETGNRQAMILGMSGLSQSMKSIITAQCEQQNI